MNATAHMRIVPTRRRRWSSACSALLPILLALASSAAPAHAQALYEAGYPTIVNHTPNEYGGGTQNWAITQDERGVMFVGNNSGLLEYDGQTWRLHTVPNRTPVRSLATDEEGRIYAGAVGELGYFAPDPQGWMSYHSLIDYLPEEHQDFADVWLIHYLDDKVYFNIGSALLVWKPDAEEFTVVESTTAFHVSFLAGGHLYVRAFGTGLHVMDPDDTLRLLPGGAQFADEPVYSVLPFPGKPGTLLITTRTEGLFTFDGTAFAPFATAADAFLRENPVYFPGTLLSDDTILLGTISGGAIIIDHTGRVLERYNQQAGISGDAITYTFQDRSGLVWLATNSGLSVVDYRSPLRFLDQRNQYADLSSDIVRHNGDLVVSGNAGVYRLAAGRSTFQKLDNFDGQAFQLLSVGDDLLVATINGVFAAEENRLVPVRRSVARDYVAYVLTPSRLDADQVIVGTANGLASLRRSTTGWSDEGLIAEIPGQKTSIVEMGEREFWVGTQGAGLYRVQQAADGGAASGRRYGAAEGLQPGAPTVFETGDRLYVKSPDSLYVYDEGRDAFYSDPSDALIAGFYRLTDQKRSATIGQDRDGSMWIRTEDAMTRGVRQADGAFAWATGPFRRIAAEGVVGTPYQDARGITWFTTISTGILAYNTNAAEARAEREALPSFPVLIRRVEAGADSTLFFGNADQTPATRLAYADNSLRFTYAAAYYEAKGGHRFRTTLEGLEDGWAAWSELPVREYVNLPPGEYTFQVKAQSPAGVESMPAVYAFTILPPWWRTPGAYLGYLLLAGALVYGAARLQRQRLARQEAKRARIREAELAAEAQERRRADAERLSAIGRAITSTLSTREIISIVYENVNGLMDAAVFGIGIYNPDTKRLDFPATKENGEILPSYAYPVSDERHVAVRCFNECKEIIIGDYQAEMQRDASAYAPPVAGEEATSVIYLPLVQQDRVTGVITTQSFERDAYTAYHVNILRNLAAYAAIALDNASAYRQLRATLHELKTTQQQLVQQEKLASLGELTAGIAHEIKNPLNFITNFSALTSELADEIGAAAAADDLGEVRFLVGDLQTNAQMIEKHGRRADSIVRSMMEHARTGSGTREAVDLNTLIDEYVDLAYHGKRATRPAFNAEVVRDYGPDVGQVEVVPQEFGRVVLNLVGNAFDALLEHGAAPNGHAASAAQGAPRVQVATRRTPGAVELRVADNGPGIPEATRQKIFEPFFTTKETGKGTGLGLSMSYDIITKGHGGRLTVASTVGEGATFTVTLPTRRTATAAGSQPHASGDTP
jgi:signal transduction histidine kinase/ligand-binding sensor domain-containing protein